MSFDSPSHLFLVVIALSRSTEAKLEVRISAPSPLSLSKREELYFLPLQRETSSPIPLSLVLLLLPPSLPFSRPSLEPKRLKLTSIGYLDILARF